MAWKFVSSDDFPLPLLLEYEKFYADDLIRAEASLAQIRPMESRMMKVKNGPKIITNAILHVKQSRWNLEKVKEAIVIARAKGN